MLVTQIIVLYTRSKCDLKASNVRLIFALSLSLRLSLLIQLIIELSGRKAQSTDSIINGYLYLCVWLHVCDSPLVVTAGVE